LTKHKRRNQRLQIPPIGEFEDQRPVLSGPGSRQVIVGIYQEEIGGRFVSPLQAGIDIEIAPLLIVLNVGGEKQGIGHGYIDFGSDQPKVRFIPWRRQQQMGIRQVHQDADIRLNAIS
jgi:hypothetical protein